MVTLIQRGTQGWVRAGSVAAVGPGVGDDYFDDGMAERQAVIWLLATRRQLERWEPLVLAHVEGIVTKKQVDRARVWQGEMEHHFLLIALANLIEAVAVGKLIPIDATFGDDIKGTRDLLEHWTDNMPIFNVTPRPRTPPRKSGKD